MRFQAGKRQLELLESQPGETDLAYIGGAFYLLTTCDVNHCIAKELVEDEWNSLAERSGQGIAIEELSGIRERVRVRNAQRRQHSSWAFEDMRKKIAYKACLLGIPVKVVDPRSTSRTCSECGHCEKGNP